MTETYNGWTNRETWLVGLWINNEEGWQESVHDAIRAADLSENGPEFARHLAGDIVRENVESLLDLLTEGDDRHPLTSGLFGDLLGTALGRVDWRELGAAFLRDVAEQDQ